MDPVTLCLKIRHTFASGFVLDAQATLVMAPGTVTAILGPSGCGKTTLLRCVAGLERVDQGEVLLGDGVWTRTTTQTLVPPWLRHVGWVPQDGALFPHLDVAHNISYAAPDVDTAAAVLRALDLQDLAARFPAQLSGGQRQRVALGRALAARPALLLLDEPLSALDTITRDETRATLRGHIKASGVPALLVTHDRGDVLALADQVVVMDAGRVLQHGAVAEVFAHPANAAVAHITGVDTVAQGQVEREDAGLLWVRVGDALVQGVAQVSPGSSVLVCVRAEDVVLQRGEPSTTSMRNRLLGRVVSVTPQGALCRVNLDVGFELGALVTRAAADELDLKPGMTLHALFKAQAVTVVPRG